MPIFARTKSVTGPLDDRVKNQIVGCDVSQTDPAHISSGSEHSDVLSPSSHSISDLCHCFLRHKDAGDTYDRSDSYDLNRTDSDSESDSKCDCSSDSDSERTDVITDGLISVLRNLNLDRYRNLLLLHVIKASEISRSIKLINDQTHNRNVMLYLQKKGYNAAVCKTSWKSCGGLTAGNHEFIDVVHTDTGDRYFIDINFASEFEIARETKHFLRVSNYLPTIFVGKQEHLKPIVKLISDAARKSLKTRGLLLPPWRKNRFMQNKWFGPYRRTVNYTPTNMNISSTTSSSGVHYYCLYGFNAVSVSNGATLLPVATRTR